MSAFVVEDKTINRILFWLRSTRDGHKMNLWYVNTLAEAAELDTKDPLFLEKLGASMAMMNTDAVNDRYRESQEAAFEYRIEGCNDLQALKSLRCWLYQCSEGDVPERKIFKAWEHVSFRLAFAIVDRLEAYEKAEWA